MSEPAEHLAPGFDPRTLKVSQLRSVLLQYSVPYIATAKKQDLVALYETSIRPRAAVSCMDVAAAPEASLT